MQQYPSKQKNYIISLFNPINISLLISAQTTTKIIIPEDEKLMFTTLTGSEHLFITTKSKVKSKRSSYYAYDHDFNVAKTYRTTDRYKHKDIALFSNSAKTFLSKKGRGYIRASKWNAPEGDPFFDGKDLNGELNDSRYYEPFYGPEKMDAVPFHILTDDYYIGIGRRDGRKNFKKGKFIEMEILLYKKTMQGEEESYLPLELPKDYSYGHTTPNLVFANNDFFILSYRTAFSSRYQIHHPVYYNYNGEIIKDFDIDLRIPEELGDFAVLNISGASFVQYSRTLVDGSNANIQPYQFATSDSNASFKYDNFTDTFYMYGGINNKEGDDGFLVTKFDNQGNRLWQKYLEMEGSKFRYINSYNRVLYLIPTTAFVGLRFYSVKGKDYNDVYILDKDSGETIKSKTFTDKEYRKSGLFNEHSAIMGVYDPKFKAFADNFEFTYDDDRFRYGYFDATGFVAITLSKKDEKLTCYKFEF